MLSSLLAVSMSLVSAVPTGLLAAENTESDELTVASFNIAAKGSKTAEIGSLMKKYGVDLAGFQEVDLYNGRNNKDMLQEIAQAAGEEYDHAYAKAIDYSGGAYGIGMIADAPLTSPTSEPLETGGYEGRVWQRAETEIQGKTIAFYNTHLTWEDPVLRAQQMETLLHVLEEDTTTYKVLTGDFNAQDSTDEWNVFLKEYTMANGNPDFLDTYIPADASMSTNAIDNIITTRNLRLKQAEAVEASETGSDHRALIASFEILDEEEPSDLLLERLSKKAEKLLEQPERYTEESAAFLQQALEAAGKASRSTQEAINTAADALQAAMDALESIPAELVAYYDFEGDNPLADKTGRGNDAAQSGSLSYQTSVSDLGQAMSTANGYASVAKTTEDLVIGTSDFSVSFWYKASSPGAWSAVIGDKNWASGGNPGMLVVQGQGQFYNSYAANGHGQQENIVSGTAARVYDGKWHHVAAVLDRDEQSILYVDGVKIAACSIASTKDVSVTTPYPFNIGADGVGEYRINSLIDEVKVYKAVLDEDAIQAEYEAHRDQSAAALENLIRRVQSELSSLTVDPAVQETMPEFESEDGRYIARLYCSENDVLISDSGELLRTPLTDTQAQVSYVITENKEGADPEQGEMIQDCWITVKGSSRNAETDNKAPQTVPSLQEWKGEQGSFRLSNASRIVVDAENFDVLQPAARITSEDIHDLFGLVVPVAKGAESDVKAGDVFLTFAGGKEELGEQGYTMESGSSLIIRATAYRGALFGTRSMLQGMLADEDGGFACGTAVDYPNYPIREFMLDIGRKYFPMWYLEDLMKYASWFKLTDFQAHLSEDTFNNYSAFRLESDIPHLTSTDGYYTKDEYRAFQKHAAEYGIRVITEIDGPAHSRRFIELSQYDDVPDKYKNIALNDTMLNLSEDGGSRQRVFNLMDDILEEYLGGDDPVILTDAFNIGMDEYYGDGNDLRAYAVHMYDKVVNTYGKTAFGWDSNASLPNENYPAEMYPMDDIIINFWKWEEVSGGMKALMDAGYKVVNGDHRWYIVPGAQIGFYDYCNEEKLFKEVSAGSMIGWYGGGIKFPEGHPNIVGGNMLLWNDRGMFAGYTVNDIFARQQSQYPILAQAYWSGKQNAGETYEQWQNRLAPVSQAPSMDNLVKDIPSLSDLVYEFDMESLENGVLKDTSGNGYDAEVTNGTLVKTADGNRLQLDGDGYIQGAHPALAWPMSAVFDLRIDEEQTGDIILFEETMPEQECVKKDGQFTGQEKAVIVLEEQTDGTYQLTYSREGFTFRHAFFFEKGKEYRIAFTSDESKITGGEYSKWDQPNKLYVNGELVSTLQGPARPEGFTGTWWVDSPSINMPLEKIGQNLRGSLDSFRLYSRVLSDDEVRALGSAGDGSETPEEPGTPEKGNLALHRPASASSAKSDSLKAEFATDGSLDTRWGSNYNSSTNDPFDKQEWLQIDLEKSYSLGEVKLFWESAYAARYDVQVSEDGEAWTTVLEQNEGKGGSETLNLNGAEGRYVRFLFKQAVPSEDSWQWNYGYSLFEVEIYAADTAEVSADKTLLQAALAYAENLNREGINEIVLKALDDAMDGARTVLDDPKATQDEVNRAWKNLVDVIHMMDFTSDRSALAALTAECEAIDLNRYEDGAEKEAFLAALNYAKEVLEDPAALTEVSIARAITRLTDARDALVPRSEIIDLSLLQLVYAAASQADLDQYLENGKAEFTAALEQAAAVLAHPESQQQADEAAYELNRAWLALRLRPDESLLAFMDSFVLLVSDMNRSFFSVAELNEIDAMKETAETMLAAHRNGSQEMSQSEAQKQADAIRPLMDLILSRDPQAGNTAPDQKEDPVQKPQEPAQQPVDRPAASGQKPAEAPVQNAQTAKSVKTSASMKAGMFSLLAVAAAAAGLAAESRRKNRKQ